MFVDTTNLLIKEFENTNIPIDGGYQSLSGEYIIKYKRLLTIEEAAIANNIIANFNPIIYNISPETRLTFINVPVKVKIQTGGNSANILINNSPQTVDILDGYGEITIISSVPTSITITGADGKLAEQIAYILVSGV